MDNTEALPIRTTMEDVKALCNYLSKKPTGATLKEAKAVVDTSYLDGRKLAALKRWGLLVIDGEKMKLTERGRLAARDGGVHFAAAMLEVVNEVDPYKALVERAGVSGVFTLSANDAAVHWHEHFDGWASDNENTLNDQAITFFQLAQGADLGKLVIGRRGQPSRFEFDEGAVSRFVDGEHAGRPGGASESAFRPPEKSESKISGHVRPAPEVESPPSRSPVKRVFITHGKDKKILEQVKRLVTFGKYEAVVAQERESPAKPVPEKVMDEMRSCQAAVIHVGREETIIDKDGNEHPQLNGNVLIEIGASMMQYKGNFILLVEEGVKLPSNLQGLYECRYSGSELNMETTMKLLEGLSKFT